MAEIHNNAFVAPGAIVVGNVTVEEDCGIWYHATVRAEHSFIVIGKGSNVQDNCVIHVSPGYPAVIGRQVTIGHGAIVHGSVIGDNSLIGMGAILMNGSRIGKNCIIGAGALVVGNTVIPDGSVVLGNPGKVRRQVTEEEIAKNRENAQHYVDEARRMSACVDGNCNRSDTCQGRPGAGCLNWV